MMHWSKYLYFSLYPSLPQAQEDIVHIHRWYIEVVLFNITMELAISDENQKTAQAGQKILHI